MNEPPSKPVTLADIAALAGVSRATASRALQDSALISDATKQRVQAIARAHDYRPNLLARNLRLGQSRSVVYVLPHHVQREQLMDPFMAKFITAIAVALRARDYDLLITQAGADDEAVGVRYVQTGRADGIIYLGGTTTDEALLPRMAAAAPLVVWGPPRDGQAVCTVGIDNARWSQHAVAHLIAHGRRRIAFLGEDPRWLEVQQRHAGYLAALHAAGLTPAAAQIGFASWPQRATGALMQTLLAQAPDLDAVFATSDVAAIAALQALRAAGRRVPGDVAVVGFDNIDIGHYTAPALTTVSQNLRAGAPLLIDTLLRQIAGASVASATVDGRLVVRQSCGALA